LWRPIPPLSSSHAIIEKRGIRIAAFPSTSPRDRLSLVN
jgi:hypothetical protein